ncbi:Holliday junction branch migration protein RuvA [Microbacterium sp. C7(2022)]|uniref:Holliday junction branch migration protein RuvA n=1 Tax=Microbacterium sp. C7(2022) TaxID=2992759 RepID=UPI00237B16F0|nr:Holliday junction branch migration protein RuvA [Microbacterium sp. C7(2022)]MDE0545524.1 Holliday junction branch migration protein RuvA [Microbacterium sp. C7(2022)]
MISSLRGTVAHVDSDAVVVEVGGVGLLVAVTSQFARQVHVGDVVLVHTTLVVREDSLSLFGFSTRDELAVFTLLLSVTGVGPKSALGVLSTLTVPQISDAVAGDDDAPFRRVSGIGPKTAKLIVVQLAGKIAAPAATANGNVGGRAELAPQVVQALVGLGWSERVAVEAVDGVIESTADLTTHSVPSLLRLTLAALGPQRTESLRG